MAVVKTAETVEPSSEKGALKSPASMTTPSRDLQGPALLVSPFKPTKRGADTDGTASSSHTRLRTLEAAKTALGAATHFTFAPFFGWLAS